LTTQKAKHVLLTKGGVHQSGIPVNHQSGMAKNGCRNFLYIFFIDKKGMSQNIGRIFLVIGREC